VLAETRAREQARDESNKEFLIRLCKDLSTLTDAEWDNLPKRVQEWANGTITAIKDEKWSAVFIDDIRADAERGREERPRSEERPRADERPRGDDRGSERPREEARSERPRSDERPREESRSERPTAPAERPAPPAARPGVPGRPRGTGQMYDVADVVFRFPDLGRGDSKADNDAILDKLWAEKVTWEAGKEKAVLGNVRTAQNMVDLARKLGTWKEYGSR
jgi:hypothetical protein